MSNSRPVGCMRPSELSNPALKHPSIIVIFCKVFQFFRINISNCHNEMQKLACKCHLIFKKITTPRPAHKLRRNICRKLHLTKNML